jgi:hypothetical protein
MGECKPKTKQAFSTFPDFFSLLKGSFGDEEQYETTSFGA